VDLWPSENVPKWLFRSFYTGMAITCSLVKDFHLVKRVFTPLKRAIKSSNKIKPANKRSGKFYIGNFAI
jgi:hypothetical protein